MSGKAFSTDPIFRKIMEDQFSQPILENNLRGTYAEYLVAGLLGEGWSVKSGSWNAWDIDGPNGEKLEVKSSAYLQTWTEEGEARKSYKPNPPSFGIAEHKYDYWGEPLAEPDRPADAYVFALHIEQDPRLADQRKPEQWRFYVVPTHRLPKGQKRISLAPLSRLVDPVSSDRLKAEVASVLTAPKTMIGRLNHVAIAVPDLNRAVARYRDALGAKVSEPQDLPDPGDGAPDLAEQIS